MNIVKWDPFRSLLDFPRVGSPFDAPQSEGRARNWAPVVDIYEKDGDLVIRAELPGVTRDDIDVSVEDGVLTLSGERKTEEALEDANAYRRERFFGKFARAFTLPDNVDAESIGASFKDGVLEVRVPKVERAKARKIEVAAA